MAEMVAGPGAPPRYRRGCDSVVARWAGCSPVRSDEPFDGYYSARRGTYRIIYRVDEAKRVVEIHSIRHRRDAYRT
jgi:hypothetical protein